MQKLITRERAEMAKITDIKNAWALSAEVDARIGEVLGVIPGRWGRMTPLSRLLIVEVGRVLQGRGILRPGLKCSECGLQAGLIGGTRRGSLHTDLAFIESMKAGPGLASPALFGYTLPNIPLAEAASHYGLIGPVYAVFDEASPLTVAEREARLLLNMQQELSLMLACEFDHYAGSDGEEELSVTLTLIEQNADSYPGLSEMA